MPSSTAKSHCALTSSLLAFVLISLFSPAFGQTPGNKPTEDSSAISQEKAGVECRIEQIQIQRIPFNSKLMSELHKFGIASDDFGRTIAISISLLGQGDQQGPFELICSNNTRLSLFVSTNQQFMSRVANAEIEKDRTHTQLWFAVPESMPFSDIFPLTLVVPTTNAQDQNVKFEFTDITP